jgi:hypothetical protein
MLDRSVDQQPQRPGDRRLPDRRLAAAMNASSDEVSGWLRHAQRAGLIDETREQPGSFRFSHGLVRDAVAAQLTGVRRAQLHADLAQVHAAEAGEVASQDAIDGAEHAWRAGSEVDAEAALQLLNRARADAWARSAYRDVAEIDRPALEVCARMPAGSARFDHEVDLQMQLASVEAVVNGQSSAKVLEGLRRSSDIGPDVVQSTTAVAMGCLEACGTGRYHDASVLSDSLIDFFGATGDPIAGSAGYYIRALTEFMRGRLDASLGSLATLLGEVPTIDWEQYGALASFQVLAYGVAGHARGLLGDVDGARTAFSAGMGLGADRNDAFGAVVAAYGGDPAGVDDRRRRGPGRPSR